jgi:Flp pilus assembly protein TadD
MRSEAKLLFFIFTFIVLGLLLYGYNNHFHNPFHFDDDHAICSNQYIRDLNNFPKFWTDATTFSSLPANQAYRPGITTLNAFDFWLEENFPPSAETIEGWKQDSIVSPLAWQFVDGKLKKPEPYYYHIHIFLSYLLLGVLLFFMINKIFQISLSHRWTPFFALFATALFMLHTANVETITYIISRSDSGSTLMIVMAMIMYMYKPQWRKYYFYVLPVLIGFFVKEPAIMFAPILFIFILLFEEKISFTSVFDGRGTIKALKSFIRILPLFVLAFFLFAWAMHKTPETWTSGAGTGFFDRINYLNTQAFVVIHYFNNFFFPFNLSADTDWKIIPIFFKDGNNWKMATNFLDDRVLIGILFISTLIVIAFKTSKDEKKRPIAFGLFWFFIALFPTSSIFPFAEVLNDHRTFFPYIGLTIASIWPLALLAVKYEKQIVSSNLISIIIVLSAFFVLSAHTYGVRTRVEVWSSGENLWGDVAKKSPNNGRGLMNYGNALMGKGDFSGAREYYNKAKALYPYYPYIFVNLGILDAATGDQSSAENNFKYALQLDKRNPESYYYYANWLRSQNRIDEARNISRQGLNISPNHINLNNLSGLLQKLPSGASKLDAAIVKVKEYPTPENYLNLSLELYNAGKFEPCIKASLDALKLKPDYDLAYNNICAAYNMLKQWDKAIEAANKGLKINPDNKLLKGNLTWALQEKNKK